jgi:hypothetical protein
MASLHPCHRVMRRRGTLIKQHFAKSDKLKKRLPPTRNPDTPAIEP